MFRGFALLLAFAVSSTVLALPARAEEPASAVGPLMKLFQSGRLPAARQGAVVEMICNRGNEHDLRVVFDRVVQPDGFPDDLNLKAMGWLADAATTRKITPSGDLSALSKLAESRNPALRKAAIRLGSQWKLQSFAPALKAILSEEATSEELQQVAIDGLVAIGGADAKSALLQIAQGKGPVRIRMLSAGGLASFDVKAAASAAADVLASATPQDDPTALLNAFFDRKDGADELAAALATRKLSVDVAKRSLRTMYAVGRSDAKLSEVLSTAAGVAADPKPPSPEEVAQLVKDVIAHGDPARGERIFRRADLSCLRCHSVNRAGGQVGPDLSAVGGSSPVDYVVNSVLNPNLAVKEQYVTKVFILADGRVLTGVVVDRDDTRVRMRDAQGKLIIIPTADVDEEVEGKSLMPQGITKFLTREELLDLIKFISELGKPGPYAVRQIPTIQRWRMLKNPSPELINEVPHLEHLRQLVLGSDPEAWSSVYGMVSGAFPLDELRTDAAPKVVILQGEIQVNEPGALTVHLHSTETAQIWVDDQPHDAARPFDVTLSPGRHTFTVRVEISNRPSPELKLELTKPQGSAIQFDLVGGL